MDVISLKNKEKFNRTQRLVECQRLIESKNSTSVSTILHINSETNALPPSVMIEFESACMHLAREYWKKALVFISEQM